MGRSAGKKDSQKANVSFSRDAKVADIRIASKSLAEAKDYSEGYPATMQLDNHVGAKRK